jgi:hypothetical protein
VNCPIELEAVASVDDKLSNWLLEPSMKFVIKKYILFFDESTTLPITSKLKSSNPKSVK